MQRVRSRMNIRVATKSGEAQVDSSTLQVTGHSLGGNSILSQKKSDQKVGNEPRVYNTGKYMYGYCS